MQMHSQKAITGHQNHLTCMIKLYFLIRIKPFPKAKRETKSPSVSPNSLHIKICFWEENKM